MRNYDGFPVDRIRWEYENGPGRSPDPEEEELLAALDHALGLATKVPDERRVAATKARASQGDRTDWEGYLRGHTPRGFNVIPNRRLSHKVKTARAKSLKAAAQRRESRTDGITIHYDKRAWMRLKQSAKDAFVAQRAIVPRTILGPETGVRWHFHRDFGRGYDDAGGMDYLFRAGTAARHR